MILWCGLLLGRRTGAGRPVDANNKGDNEMSDPKALLAEAHQALDLTGTVMTHGATIAPDFVMRTLIAMRAILDRHVPTHLDAYGAGCVGCDEGEAWPCPDATAIFKVLAVGEEDDDA